MSLFIPDLICETVYDIPIEYFTDKKIQLLFMDIDNTLVTYDDAVPTEKNIKWFNRLASCGIDVVFISNNNEERVKKYAAVTGYEYYADVSKPSCKIHKKIMKDKGLSPAQCAAVGDQIFTDVLAAHLAGCIAVVVSPIKDLENLFFKSKRALEKPFTAYYRYKTGKGTKK